MGDPLSSPKPISVPVNTRGGVKRQVLRSPSSCGRGPKSPVLSSSAVNTIGEMEQQRAMNHKLGREYGTIQAVSVPIPVPLPLPKEPTMDNSGRGTSNTPARQSPMPVPTTPPSKAIVPTMHSRMLKAATPVTPNVRSQTVRTPPVLETATPATPDVRNHAIHGQAPEAGTPVTPDVRNHKIQRQALEAATPVTPDIRKVAYQFVAPSGFASALSGRTSAPNSSLTPRPIPSNKNTPARAVDYRKHSTPPWPKSSIPAWPTASAKTPSATPPIPRRTPLSTIQPNNTPTASRPYKLPQIGTAPAEVRPSRPQFATPCTPTGTELQRKSVSVGGTLASPSPATGKIAALAQFRVKIKTYRFFFDCVDQKKKEALSKQIKDLGGTVEVFNNKNVTHLITDNPALGNDPRTPVRQTAVSPIVAAANSSIRLKQSGGIIQQARKFNAIVWHVDKLGRIFEALNGTTAPRKLQDHLRDEKLYGVSTARSADGFKQDFRPFKYRYLLVEECSDHYAPVLMKQYKDPKDLVDPPWPVIYYNQKGKCAFVHYTSESEEQCATARSELNQDDLACSGEEGDRSQADRTVQDFCDKENLNVPAASGFAQHTISTASGLISGSPAILSHREPPARTMISQMGQREMHLHRGQATTIPAIKKPSPVMKNSKKRGYWYEGRFVAAKAFYQRPGFCENCNTKYDVFLQHVESTMHKNWLKQANFQQLDDLIGKLQRSKTDSLAHEHKENVVEHAARKIAVPANSSPTLPESNAPGLERSQSTLAACRFSITTKSKRVRTDHENPFLVVESRGDDRAESQDVGADVGTDLIEQQNSKEPQLGHDQGQIEEQAKSAAPMPVQPSTPNQSSTIINPSQPPSIGVKKTETIVIPSALSTQTPIPTRQANLQYDLTLTSSIAVASPSKRPGTTLESGNKRLRAEPPIFVASSDTADHNSQISQPLDGGSDDEVLTVGSNTPRKSRHLWPRSHSDFLRTVLNPN